ncbi:prepilin peptidase [Rathayibacter sp. VKM Ac-2927]|uniref:prepilin peptidase n=1 Tax=Rathayibacter sp. VKM Ac-2927 TaxID=2929478 RepID=UPI001FB382BD|nr:prepilin peptidase [Rathayibacter sp. VKM Ac-2927]MCJ1685747.1 prepilin peptidase [Rathayibacter sp. VKM Ac-2927]
MHRLQDLSAALVGALLLGAIGLARVEGLAAIVVLVVAAATVPLVVADVRERRLPNALTVPILLVGLVSMVGGVLSARVSGELPAVLATALVLGLLHLAGGLGRGDVKLGTGLALPLAAIDPALALLAPVLAFVLAGAWSLPSALRGGGERIPFGPFQLAAFWIVIVGA